MKPVDNLVAGVSPGASRPSGSTERTWLLGSGVVVLCAAVAKLIIHLYSNRYYGYFIDEFYYLACGRLLAWGYVDQPPLIPVIVRFETLLFGDSLAAIRFLPAVAGAGKIILTGLIARELGGGRFAQDWRHWRCFVRRDSSGLTTCFR
jgi:hypothetical protein